MSQYKSYQAQMKKALEPRMSEKNPLIVLKGGSDFMLTLTYNALRAQLKSEGHSFERIEGASFTAERFLQATASRSMFDDRQMTVVTQAFTSPDLYDSLKRTESLKQIQPVLCLMQNGEVPAKFAKELTRLGAFLISCDEPATWEAKDFLADRAKTHDLQLAGEAQALMLDATGSDIVKIENELKKLALILGPDAGSLSADKVRPHLDFLREDNTFKVDQLLCQEAYAQALLLLKSLLDRGESSLGILAILAMHCRKALQIQAGMRSGSTPADLSRELRLPLFVVQAYLPYIKKRGAPVFQRALNLCHEADRRLKSIRHGEEMWLDKIVWELIPT